MPKTIKMKPIFFFLTLLNLFSCEYNPALDKKEFILMSEKEEKRIGKQENSRLIKQFGGVYENQKLQNYINSLGEFLVSTSELPDLDFTFTIIDTPIINAFALPGGFIYLTRGLLAICQNEAQLAGVLAHEIGHVTARHSAKRYTKNFGVNFVSQILGALAKDRNLTNVVNQSAGLYLLSYSRSQEYEADKLAVRYMKRAGFDPMEMSNFLRIMGKYSLLQNRMLNQKKNIKSSLLSTHPSSPERVKKVIKESELASVKNPITGREIFLKKIDGMTFGPKKEQGFLNSDSFIHPKLGIFFKLDKDFFFINSSENLVGLSGDNAKIIFDLDRNKKNNDFKSYFRSWSNRNNLTGYREFIINDLSGATTVLNFKKQSIRFVIITKDQIFYRFILICNEDEKKIYTEKLFKILKTFKISSDFEEEDFVPNKIVVKTINESDNITKLLQNQNLQPLYSEELFLLLNDINKKDLKAGRKIKTINRTDY